MPYKFKCPYCFGECEDSKVYFRATVSYDDRQLRELRSTGKDQLVELKARFTKYNARSEEVEKLIKFWEDKGGEAGYQTDAGWNMPYIDPEQDDFGLLIRDFQTGNYKVGSDGFVRDEDGFVRRVIDRFGSEFKPMKRLCPHCLNPLPLEDYGKYKTKFISVVGTTGAGKTVYLYQLLHNFQAIMRAAGCHVGAGNLDDLGEHVDPNFPLPGATDSRLMRRPLAVNLEKPNGEKLTLVFYDVAGEHFAEKTEMDSTLQEGSGVTSYIRNCDAMMLLIDPVQIRALAPGGHTMRAEDVQKTVTQIQKIRSTWQEVPTAVVLTKSDNPEVVNQFPPTAMFLQNIGGNQQGFQRDEFVEVNRELRSFMSSNATNTYSTIEGAIQSVLSAGEPCEIDIMADEYEPMFYDCEELLKEMEMRHSEVRLYSGEEAVCRKVAELAALTHKRLREKGEKKKIFVLWIGLAGLVQSLAEAPDEYPEAIRQEVGGIKSRKKSLEKETDDLMQSLEERMDALFGSSEDSFDMGSDEEEQETDDTEEELPIYNIANDVESIVRTGPRQSIVTVVFHPSVSALKRSRCVSVDEFRHRIAFGIGSDDALAYLNSSRAIKDAEGNLIDDSMDVYYDGRGYHQFAPFYGSLEETE